MKFFFFLEPIIIYNLGNRARSTSFRLTGSFRGMIEARKSIVVPLSVVTVL